MGDTVAGIALPPGEPGAVRDAARGLRGAGSGFQRTGSTARAAAASVSWRGQAASAFAARTGDYEDAARMADAASVRAASVLDDFADRLEQGRERVKRLQEQAEEAEARMNAALREAADAGEREAAARDRAAASLASPLDATGISMAEQSQALQDADANASTRMRMEGVAADAKDELERLCEEAERERDAVKEAATAAAGRLNGAEDGLPVVAGGAMLGRSGAVEDRVLARIRAGDYSVMEGVPLNSLSEDTQRAIGAEVATDADQAATGEGDRSIEAVAGFVGRHNGDGDFAAGFYNRLGGQGANEFASNLSFFHSDGKGLESPGMVALMMPFATLLGTATKSKGLRKDFTQDFLGTDRSIRDRYARHAYLKPFVMAADGPDYSPQFLADFGEEVMIAPGAPTTDPEGSIITHDLNEHRDLMDFIAENPDAAGLLLSGTHGPDGHFSNAAPLFRHAPFYDDDGHSLGALIHAGTHDAEGSIGRTASEQVIRIAPIMEGHTPDGVKQPLLTILKNHVVGFEHAAADAAYPEDNYPRGDNIDITYSEGSDYMKLLLGSDGETQERTIEIVGGQVGDNIYEATGKPPGVEKEELLVRAAALDEMGVQAGIDADIGDAEGEAQENKIKQFFAEKAVDAAGGRITAALPGSDIIVGKAIEGVFPTDQVELALKQARRDDLAADERIRWLQVAAEVQHGNLPVEALQVENVHGGGSDSYDINSDGDTDDVVARYDVDRDGDRERVTERELRSIVNENVEALTPADTKAQLGMLHDAEANPPGLSDFSDALPDDYSHDGNWIFGDEIDGPGDDGVDYEIEQHGTSATLKLSTSDGELAVKLVWSADGGWVPAR